MLSLSLQQLSRHLRSKLAELARWQDGTARPKRELSLHSLSGFDKRSISFYLLAKEVAVAIYLRVGRRISTGRKIEPAHDNERVYMSNSELIDLGSADQSRTRADVRVVAECPSRQKNC